MTSPSYETLIVKHRGPIAEIRFNRPHRLNAVIETLYREVLDALDQAEADPAIRVVILTGEGRAFCVGADMKAHGSAQRSLYERRRYLQLGNDVCERILCLKLPAIAAVNGYALGAGAEMAVACDFIVMDDEAQLGFPETGIGTCVGGGVSKLLPRLVGLSKARELLYTGRRIDGKEATRIGLAVASSPADTLAEEVDRLAESLACQAPVSMAMLKRLVNQGSHTDLESQLQQELDAVFTCSTTADWQEGVDAFAEKRSPVFRGC
ncbi:enoyl-CoA hydratase/isomerase family protein [Aidingimonas halophila]|uniref:Enoyl-CoA hydratase n=1 Tax=Aidingimonas halophila TaxID=574349 RepID=A0A1H3EXR4_9GAMM|nr:enoyl-CoA hydratase/isomerase family protein [Aidingimonas halophila]GHC31955.1 3-hydroxybutyryl-CoA dehydratase [Aidingimonas halophila]SDX83613.1 enoyl-CoA hydratase [Aidingimonas halophila]